MRHHLSPLPAARGEGKGEGLLVLIALFLFVSCASTRPAGKPVAPLTAATPEEAMQQLRAQREAFRGMRSLMRVRATTKGKTQSFRAQLQVHDAQRMDLIAYTPVGTTALKLKANGHSVDSDPAVAPEAFQFLRGAGLTPAQTGMLVLGLPPQDDLRVEYASGGLASASAGHVTVQFDPPSFPAKRVIVISENDRVEIEHVEVVREN